MIAVSLLAIAQRERFGPPTDIRELARVRSFMREAYTGLDADGPISLFDQQGMPTVSETDGRTRRYNFRFANVWINGPTGRIENYYGQGGDHATHDSQGILIPRRVSDSDAAFLARRFLAAAGFTGEIAVTGVQDLMGMSGLDVEIRYVPVTSGVPYDSFASSMEIERQTGILHDLSYPPFDLPVPPGSLKPALSLAAARTIALDSGVELRGEALAVSPQEGFRLVVWTPSATFSTARTSGAIVQAKSPAVRAALGAKRGILAYAGWLLGGSNASSVRIVVDANTGETLATQEPFSMRSTGGGGSGFASDPKSLAIPTDARPWRASLGKGSLAGPAKAALAPASAPAPRTGTPVVLTDGALAFPATYDARANLLGVAGKAYRPGPALAALLRRKAGPRAVPPARRAAPKRGG